MGSSGNPGGLGPRARRLLNEATIAGMQQAFNLGGQRAIMKVMRNNPAMFLKMLVLLVPREMTVEHSGGVKALSDEQLERTIAYLEEVIARRDAGASAKVIEPVDVDKDMGNDAESVES